MALHSRVQIMHFIDNMQDSKRNLEQIQARLGKNIKRREPDTGFLDDLTEEMEEQNKTSLAAEFRQGDPRQLIKFLDAKIALLDSITDTLTELYKIQPDAKFEEKLKKWQPQLDVCLDSAWRQLVQVTQIQPNISTLPELDSKKPEISDFIAMRHAITKVWIPDFDAPSFKKKVGEEKKTSFEAPKQPVEIDKPVPKSLHNFYVGKTDTKEGGRWHALEVDSNDFASAGQNFKQQYQNQRGDYLKTNILNDFKEKIENTSSPTELDNLIKELERSTEYKVLAKAQGIVTRIFGGETSSIKAFKEMIVEKKDEFNVSDNSIQHN